MKRPIQVCQQMFHFGIVRIESEYFQFEFNIVTCVRLQSHVYLKITIVDGEPNCTSGLTI
jgi:hypothetical protein